MLKHKLRQARQSVAGFGTRLRVAVDSLINQQECLRMAQWLLLSIVAYLIATWLAGIPTAESPAGLYPRAQAILWKCGHLNLAAFIGYWIGRTRLGRLTPQSSDMKHLAHALIIVGAMLAFGMAL